MQKPGSWGLISGKQSGKEFFCCLSERLWLVQLRDWGSLG